MISKFKDELNQRKGQQKSLLKELNKKQTTLEECNELLLDLEEAILIVQKVSKDTQEGLLTQLSSLVTEALDVVFVDEGYSFILKPESKANGMQITPLLLQNGHEYSMKADIGYGIVQVVGYALKIALLMLKKNATKILLIDEPNKDISAEYKGKASEFMSTIANKLDVQCICVTHEESIKKAADHTFVVTKNKNGSQVEELISEHA